MSYSPVHLSVILAGVFWILLCLPSSVYAEGSGTYELSLAFDLQAQELIGTARITIPAGERLSLSYPDIRVTGTLLRETASGRENSLLPAKDGLILPAADNERTLYISYIYTAASSTDNLITSSAITLTRNWYPKPVQAMRFTLSASLPSGFTAVSESDSFPLQQSGEHILCQYSQPTTTIHFLAAPYIIGKRQVREGLMVYSMFFPEDQELADGYLQAATDYITRYEAEIGAFPYNHYVIVANRLPTGYGMPTFTLLGQRVLRLPFIKDTSLGHEIVHSWFGNAVEVDYSQGNWCEGLVSFLADHAFRNDLGEGVAARKEAITRYLNYVHESSALPLADFISANHTQRMAEVSRTVGYNRGALFFHELQTRIGYESFRRGIQLLYSQYSGRTAAWNDLLTSFSQASGEDLHTFFEERLNRTEIPALSARDISIKYHGPRPSLSFTLLQETKEPFSLKVPVSVQTMNGETDVIISSNEPATQVVIDLDQRPLSLTLDPHYSMLRQLSREEYPAVWSQFLGAQKPLIVLEAESVRDKYTPFLDYFAGPHTTIVTADRVSNKELGENTVLFLGTESAASRALFGDPGHRLQGLTLDVRRNPLNADHVAVLLNSSSKEESAAALRLLKHYGKYSYLEFDGGRNRSKALPDTPSGIRFVLEELPAGGATTDINSFEKILEALSSQRVIYVGESHTSLSDHLLQLRIIEAVYQQNPQLVIAMEMFPTSSQEALDNYIRPDGNMDEQSFLKESGYFNVWRYDFRLFRDIFNFAKAKHIPVIGINLHRDIVSRVFKSGGTDTLTPEELHSLPGDRVLDMEGYTERLRFMHNVHVQGGHGNGGQSGFIQAQAIWDETMADNIATYLKDHPQDRMVVLAGSQHTRKDSGIPPRVARRIKGVDQAVILNIYGDNPPSNLSQLADYFFLNSQGELPEIPKIGIVLISNDDDSRPGVKIHQLSPHGKAAAAGLQEGDRLISVNGVTVSEMADLRIAMLDTSPGDIIDVTIGRKKEDTEVSQTVQVELTISPAPADHP